MDRGFMKRGLRVLHLHSLSENRFSAGFGYDQNLTIIGDNSRFSIAVRYEKARMKVAGSESLAAKSGRDEWVVSGGFVSSLTRRRRNE